jgi:hypothetical protein
MLSDKTYNLLANTLAPKVIDELYSSDEFITFLHEQVPAVITKELGEVDEDVLFELSLVVMDKIILTSV